MINKKRAIVSLGAGSLTFVIASFVILLTWKILRSPEWMSIVLVWLIAWPILLSRMIGIPYPGRAVRALAFFISITIYVAALSGLIYTALSRRNTKSERASPPPPPVPFQ